MIIKYPIKITLSSRNTIRLVEVPDLDLIFNIESDNEFNNNANLLNYLREHIENSINSGQVIFKEPKKIKDYLNSSLNTSSNAIWSKVYVNVNIHSPSMKIFSKLFPAIGVFSNLTSAFCFAITALIAARLTTGPENTSSKYFSLIGSFIYFFIYIMVFFKSGAINNLSRIGNYFDKNISYYISSNEHYLPDVDNKRQRSNKHCTVLIISSLGMAALLSTNALMSGITTYQEIIALGGRAEAANLAYINNSTSKILAILTVVTNSIDSLAFQGTFGKELVVSIDNYLFKLFPLSPQNNMALSLEERNLVQDDTQSRADVTPNFID